MKKSPLDNAEKNGITITVKISGDREIEVLNKEYLNVEGTTDVLSFNIEQKLEDGSLYLGDIVVNKQQAQRQAGDYANTLEEEIAELVAHGVLHLLGVHHDGDDENGVHGKKAN